MFGISVGHCVYFERGFHTRVVTVFISMRWRTKLSNSRQLTMDMACCRTKVRVLPYVADHKGILAELPCAEILEMAFEREVWHLASADWDSLEEALNMIEWHALSNGTAEDALAYFQEVLWLHLVKYFPRRKVKITKRSHPWLNERNQKSNSTKE